MKAISRAMTHSHPASPTGAEIVSPDHDPQDLDGLFTLKQALSANHTAGTHTKRNGLEKYRDTSKSRQQPQKITRNDPPSYIDIPQIPNAAEAALAALQYLPTPLLVLSSLRTILLANEAMGRLLGLDIIQPSQQSSDDVAEEELAPWEMLRGQSLSQIGIDMIQDGNSVIVDWEVRRLRSITNLQGQSLINT